MSTNRLRILAILALAALLRLIQLDAPPVGRHAWRQSDTASVARNFHRLDPRLLYPQIDWQTPGYVEMEFPVYPWVTAAVYRVTGESHAAARGLALLGFLLTIALLHALVRRSLGEEIALWAAFFLAVLPLGLFLGRAIMPEAWMLAASTAALYAFLRWIEEQRWRWFIIAAGATALAGLLKPTALLIGLPMHWLVWQRWGRRCVAQWPLWLFALLVFAPIAAWYAHAYRLGQEFGASFHVLTAAGSDKWGQWQLLASADFYRRVFLDYLGGRILTWVGLLVFGAGLVVTRRAQHERLFDVWLAGAVAVVLIASGGSYQHDYYLAVLLLPAVVFMGKAIEWLWRRQRGAALGVVLAIAVLGLYRFLGQLADERAFGPDQLVVEALTRQTEADELGISCNLANPVWLYLADRRGWGRDCASLDREELYQRISQGALFLVGRNQTTTGRVSAPLKDHLRSFHRVVEDNESVFLARLRSQAEAEGTTWRAVLASDPTHTATAFWPALTRPAEAGLSIWELPPCRTCSVRIALDLRPWARNEAKAGRRPRPRISFWSSHRDRGFQVSLNPRRGSLRYRQILDQQPVETRTVHHLASGPEVVIELRFDGLEFALLVDGSKLVQTPSQLGYPLAGRLVVRADSTGQAIRRVEYWTPETESASQTRAITPDLSP